MDDDASVRKALGRLIKSFGFTVEVFASAGEVLTAVPRRAPDCLVVDVQMPDLNGLDLQIRLADAGYSLPTIFITAHEDEQVHRQALEMGAIAFLKKPFGDVVLFESIRGATMGAA